jgi:ABC-type uncharacterized transport system substrate-binding protein
MRRREFIVLLAGAAIGLPIAVRAQRTSTPVIGFLNSTEAYPSLLNEFYDGLAETGFYEGRNVRIEYRWAEGQYDRLPELAADLVRHRVDVIVAAGGGSLRVGGPSGDEHDSYRSPEWCRSEIGPCCQFQPPGR